MYRQNKADDSNMEESKDEVFAPLPSEPQDEGGHSMTRTEDTMSQFRDTLLAAQSPFDKKLEELKSRLIVLDLVEAAVLFNFSKMSKYAEESRESLGRHMIGANGCLFGAINDYVES